MSQVARGGYLAPRFAPDGRALLVSGPKLRGLYLAALRPERLFAYTSEGTVTYSDIRYRSGDVLLFGPESVGLPPEVKNHPAVTSRVRLPMLPSRRSLNLANSASIAVYEAWRQLGFAGAARRPDAGAPTAR